MIVFGSAIADPNAYIRYAEPGIRRVAEPDSEVLAFAAVGVIGRSYNLLLDAARTLPDVEALVLVHAHAELDDPAFCAKVRAALADEDVALTGPLGARGVRSLAWWRGDVVAAPGRVAYDDHGGGETPVATWAGATAAPPADVEVLDGFVLVLSPWALEHLRFDEALRFGFGYDLDLCLQARRAGKRVTVSDLQVVHHRALELVEDVDTWVAAHEQLAATWGDELEAAGPEADDAWRSRARRAEAEREAARALAYSKALEVDARLAALEREVQSTKRSRSWQVTAPLRGVRSLSRARAERGAARAAAEAEAARGRVL